MEKKQIAAHSALLETSCATPVMNLHCELWLKSESRLISILILVLAFAWKADTFISVMVTSQKHTCYRLGKQTEKSYGNQRILLLSADTLPQFSRLLITSQRCCFPLSPTTYSSASTWLQEVPIYLHPLEQSSE